MTLTYPCPKGHDSTEPDYCSHCGALLESSASLAPEIPPAAELCPDCAAPREPGGDFCEICGYNFVTGLRATLAIAPPVASPTLTKSPVELSIELSTGFPTGSPEHQPPDRPLAPDRSSDPPTADPIAPPLIWEVTITIDPVAEDPASPPPPQDVPPFTVQLERPTTLIGRTSQARAIYPDISLDVDDAVSHRHAVLNLKGDRTLTLRDIGSANGTHLNGRELKPMIDMPLKPGDEITLGHWTRIKVLGS